MEEKRANQFLIYSMAMFSVLMWAANYPATRYALQFYSPAAIAALRLFTSAVILIIIGAAKKIRLPDKKDLPKIIACGFIGIFLFNIFLNIGATYVVSGVGSFIINSAPVFTLVLSRLFLKETVKPACWIGVLISLCGLVTVMLSQTTGFTLNIGVVFLLFSAISTSAYNVIARNLLKTYTFFESTTYCVTAAAAFFITFIHFINLEFPGNHPLSASLIIFLMGVFPAGLAYLTWAYALSKTDKTTHVAVFLYLTPFISTLIGFFWLGESLYILSLAGGFVIIGGMVLTNTLGKSRT